jgi:hypothetical protein
MTNAASSTEPDVRSVVAAQATTYFIHERLAMPAEQTPRLTSVEAALFYAREIYREMVADEALDRIAVVDAPIVLDAAQTARFHQIVAQERRELPEPPLDLGAFGE